TVLFLVAWSALGEGAKFADCWPATKRAPARVLLGRWDRQTPPGRRLRWSPARSKPCLRSCLAAERTSKREPLPCDEEAFLRVPSHFTPCPTSPRPRRRPPKRQFHAVDLRAHRVAGSAMARLESASDRLPDAPLYVSSLVV